MGEVILIEREDRNCECKPWALRTYWDPVSDADRCVDCGGRVQTVTGRFRARDEAEAKTADTISKLVQSVHQRAIRHYVGHYLSEELTDELYLRCLHEVMSEARSQ